MILVSSLIIVVEPLEAGTIHMNKSLAAVSPKVLISEGLNLYLQLLVVGLHYGLGKDVVGLSKPKFNQVMLRWSIVSLPFR